MNLRDTIKETTRKHLESGEKLLGQCITAVGWVNGTIPDMRQHIIELPCTDVSATGIASGIALAGGRPFLIIRFQDFLMLNSSCLVNFAAKQKDVWHKACPVFVRALCQEGKGTGPTHSAKLHSVFMHFPGLRIHSPITPKEWIECYQDYMTNTDPMLCCEYKNTFGNDSSIRDFISEDSDITLVGIGSARKNVVEAGRKIKADIIHISKLKPFDWKKKLIASVKKTKKCLIVDCGFDICGAGSWIAQKLGEKTNVVCHSIGLEDKPVSVAEERENPNPSVSKILNKVKSIV